MMISMEGVALQTAGRTMVMVPPSWGENRFEGFPVP